MMKRSVYTIGSLIILLIAAFVFVLVPIFSGGRASKRIPPFGKYDGTEIRYEQGTDFTNYLSLAADSYKRQNEGQNVTPEQLSAQQYRIFQYAFSMT
ncbi:MAG: hypothetical protein K2H09_07790, partial [Treponemataceae bacterium]|nr:hypothetical protein [Treponemataceae bacterium]